jgi:hypothetical protein
MPGQISANGKPESFLRKTESGALSFLFNKVIARSGGDASGDLREGMSSGVVIHLMQTPDTNKLLCLIKLYIILLKSALKTNKSYWV